MYDFANFDYYYLISRVAMGFHKLEIEKCFRQKSYYERVVDHLPAATTLSKFDETGKA